MAIVILILTSFVACVNAEPFSVVTFNAGLTPRVDHYKERRSAIGPAIKGLHADVICLQEVWFSKDMTNILRLVDKVEFPYSYSFLHEDVSSIQEISITETPCESIEFITSFVPCLELHCRNTTNQMTYLSCAKRCGLLEKLSQPCITCLILSDPKTAMKRCLLNHGNRFNTPGLLLLSKHPLINPEVTFYVPDKKLLMPRAYISTQVPDVGTVICTHTTANLGSDYFEDLPYKSWNAQNVDEARALASVLHSVPNGLIMGDLNGGPEVTHSSVSADFEDAFNTLLRSGLQSTYVNSPGICTWCVYNPLTHSHHNKILDHVFVKNITVFGAMRIFDRTIPGRTFPLSDHYGVKVILDV